MSTTKPFLVRMSALLVLGFCALLPLQTHLVLVQETVQGVDWPWTEVKLYALDFVLVLAAIGVLFTKKTISKTARHFLQLLLIFWLALFFANAINQVPLHAWVSWLRIGEGIACVWMCAATIVPLKNMLAAFVGGIFVAACFGLWQFGAQFIPESSLLGVASQFPWDAGVSILANPFARFLRSYGSFPHPNIFAGYLAVALISLLFLVLRRADVVRARKLVSLSDFFSRNGWTLIVAVFFAALMFSFSRNGWLASGIGLLFLLLLTLWQNKKMSLRVWVQCGVVAILLLIFFSHLFLPLAFGRFTLEDPHEQVSIQDRKQATQDFSLMVRDRWYRGTGMNMFTPILRAEVDPDRSWWEVQPVHNIYLLLIAETSVFGLALFLVPFFWLLGVSIHRLREHHHRFPYVGLSLALLIAVFLLGMFDHYLISLVPGLFLLFFVLGVSVRAHAEQDA